MAPPKEPVNVYVIQDIRVNCVTNALQETTKWKEMTHLLSALVRKI